MLSLWISKQIKCFCFDRWWHVNLCCASLGAMEEMLVTITMLVQNHPAYPTKWWSVVMTTSILNALTPVSSVKNASQKLATSADTSRFIPETGPSFASSVVRRSPATATYSSTSASTPAKGLTFATSVETLSDSSSASNNTNEFTLVLSRTPATTVKWNF